MRRPWQDVAGSVFAGAGGGDHQMAAGAAGAGAGAGAAGAAVGAGASGAAAAAPMKPSTSFNLMSEAYAAGVAAEVRAPGGGIDRTGRSSEEERRP